jgi:hypothetical protein
VDAVTTPYGSYVRARVTAPVESVSCPFGGAEEIDDVVSVFSPEYHSFFVEETNVHKKSMGDKSQSWINQVLQN